MEQSKFINYIAEILEISNDEIEMSNSLENLGWDSLCDLSFIALVDEKMDKKIKAQDLSDSKLVSDLYKLI